MPTAEDSGIKRFTRAFTLWYSGVAMMSASKPGPSFEYTSMMRSLVFSLQNAAAYTARFPPLEWPPTRKGHMSASLTRSRYSFALICAGTGVVKESMKSSFQPTNVESVPRKETKAVPSSSRKLTAENCSVSFSEKSYTYISAMLFL